MGFATDLLRYHQPSAFVSPIKISAGADISRARRHPSAIVIQLFVHGCRRGPSVVLGQLSKTQIFGVTARRSGLAARLWSSTDLGVSRPRRCGLQRINRGTVQDAAAQKTHGMQTRCIEILRGIIHLMNRSDSNPISLRNDSISHLFHHNL
jgi:hypothetical protein